MSDTHTLRTKIRRRRRALGLRRRLQAARLAAQQIQSLAEYRRSERVAIYLAMGGEVDCQFLAQSLWRDGKQCFLPVISQSKANTMRFVLYRPGTLMVNNRFNIREPMTSTKTIDPRALELVVVPLVAVDKQGNRVGMGGGYYDRAFANNSNKKGPVLVGVAYRFQQVSKLQPQPWDVSLDKVIVV